MDLSALSSGVPAIPVTSPPPPVHMSLFLALLSSDKAALFLISTWVQKGHLSMSVLPAAWPPNTSLVMEQGERKP